MFVPLHKDPCDSNDLKTGNYLFCILGWPESWSLGSWVTAWFIQALRLGVIYLWCPQKKIRFFTPISNVWKTEQQIICSNSRICKHVAIFKNPHSSFVAVVIDVCPLAQITLFPVVLWQITFAYTSWNLM